MNHVRHWVIISFFTITGCSNYAKTTKQDPACTTIVHGRYACPEKWIGKFPALIIRDRGDIKSHFGDIGEIDSAGVWFDRTNEGLLFSSPRYYKFDKILCLVEEENEVIYGHIPKMFGGTWQIEIELKALNNPKAQGIVLKLEPNREFSYCLPPGEYVVNSISFGKGMDYKDLSVSFPPLRLNVVENRVNFIGNFYADSLLQDVEPITVSCKIGQRPSDATAGVMFGLVGAALLEVSRSGDRIEHKITVTGTGCPENAVESLITKH